MNYTQSQSQAFNPGQGAGGFYGQVLAPKDTGPVEGIKRNFDMLSQGLNSFSENRLGREKLTLDREKFSQDMLVQQERLNLAQRASEMQATQYASVMQQQAFQNELKLKDDARKDIKTQIEAVDFHNKEALAELYRNNIGPISEILDKGTYHDLINSDEYKTMLSGLAAVDPKGSFKAINDIHTKMATENKEKRAVATYNFTAELYAEEFPNIIAAIDEGKSLTDAMEPMRLKLAELYKSGNIDHKAVTEQLKSVMSLLNSYKKKSASGGSSLTSFDAEGNQVDPSMNPGAVSRQVDSKTGKVSTVGGKSSGNPLKEMIMNKVMESMNKQ